MRIGILGGTFDPVHSAHLEMADSAKKMLGLDKVFLVPTRPWQKTARASDEQRLGMLKLAIRDSGSEAEIDTQELDRAGQSYSIDTLFAYRKNYGEDARLFFIMGTDQWDNLKTWVQWQHFPELTNLVLFKRDGYEAGDPYEGKFPIKELSQAKEFQPSGEIIICPLRPEHVSSTEIREKLYQEPSRSQSIPGLIEGVQRYILKNKLYLPRDGSHKP